MHAVRTGEPVYARLHGKPVFDYHAEHPKLANTFARSMSEASFLLTAEIVKSYDFSRFTTVADIAGGEGVLLSAILSENPSLHGILFDVSFTIDKARQLLADTPQARRCEFVAGDFFQSVPGGANCYLMKAVIHDWNDSQAVRILRNCRQRMDDKARILVIDRVLSDCVSVNYGDQYATLMDLQVLLIAGGCERSVAAFTKLFDKAGLTVDRIIAVGNTGYSIIDGSIIS